MTGGRRDSLDKQPDLWGRIADGASEVGAWQLRVEDAHGHRHVSDRDRADLDVCLGMLLREKGWKLGGSLTPQI
jgi:hypothetical protein